MSEAGNEVLHTLFNELCNNDWKFDGKEPTELNIDEEKFTINVHLDGWMVRIRIEEMMAPDRRTCGNCGKVKKGWPDSFKNIGGKGVVYACSECTKAHEEQGSGPTAV